jgi:hypothetical protein
LFPKWCGIFFSVLFMLFFTNMALCLHCCVKDGVSLLICKNHATSGALLRYVSLLVFSTSPTATTRLNR